MMRFLRKYNKMLLALFMVLLMVVFVGGSALQNLLTPSADYTVADSILGPITRSDQRRALGTTEILAGWGINWQQLSGGASEPIELVDWILLTREARHFNVQAGPAAVLAGFEGERERQHLKTLARRLRIKREYILGALGELFSVQMAAAAVASSAVPSTAEVRSAAKEILDKVKVNVVMLPAGAFVDPEAEFSEEEIESQWSPYRDNEPGAGLNFGYYVAPRLSAQYIKIDRDAIAERARIANLEQTARTYFEENRETDPAFRRPPREEPESEGSDTEEGPQEEESPFLEWEEAKETAIAAVRRNHADDAAANIANWLLQYDAEQWYDLQRDEGGYKEPPDQAAILGYYEKMLTHIPRKIAYPRAMNVVQTDFFSREEAEDVSEIGKAAYRPSTGRARALKELAFLTKAIEPTIPRDESTAFNEYLAPFQTCPYALEDSDGNKYVFRIVDAQPGHPAESVDEVRERVIRDLRLLQGWEVAKARAAGLRSCIPEISLHDAYESDAELIDFEESGMGVGFFESPPVSRFTRSDLFRGERRATRRVGPRIGEVPVEIIDQWFKLEGAWERTAVYDLEDRATIMVAEWVETQPARADQFEEQQEWLVNTLTNQRRRAAQADWFDPEKIRARNGFGPAT